MHSLTAIGQKALKCLIICGLSLVISCAGINNKKRPKLDWHVGDYENNQIINRRKRSIKTNTPQFNEFGCIKQDSIENLIKYVIGLEQSIVI